MFRRRIEKDAQGVVAEAEAYTAFAALQKERDVVLIAGRLSIVRQGFDCSESDIADFSNTLADLAVTYNVSPDEMAQALYNNEDSLAKEWDDQPMPPEPQF